MRSDDSAACLSVRQPAGVPHVCLSSTWWLAWYRDLNGSECGQHVVRVRPCFSATGDLKRWAQCYQHDKAYRGRYKSKLLSNVASDTSGALQPSGIASGTISHLFTSTDISCQCESDCSLSPELYLVKLSSLLMQVKNVTVAGLQS